jgi:hypothetical protein
VELNWASEAALALGKRDVPVDGEEVLQASYRGPRRPARWTAWRHHGQPQACWRCWGQGMNGLCARH